MKTDISYIIIGCASLSILVSCVPATDQAQQSVEATITPTIDLPPTLTLDPLHPPSWPPSPRPLAEIYDVLPGETLHEIPDGVQGEIAPGVSMGVSVYPPIDSNQKWAVGLWVYNDYCYPVSGRTQYIGDTFQFSGYSIRIVDIQSDYVVVGVIGSLLTTENIREGCLSSIYNRLPSEDVVNLYSNREKYDTLTFLKSEEIWLEEYVSHQGEALVGPTSELTIISDTEVILWEGNIHVQDVLELEDYRIQVSTVNEVYITLIVGKR
jgi:hypothetical protein